jgi:hypothetical protein
MSLVLQGPGVCDSVPGLSDAYTRLCDTHCVTGHDILYEQTRGSVYKGTCMDIRDVDARFATSRSGVVGDHQGLH